MSGRGPLRHAAFRWLLAARTTSIVGNAVAPIALAFAVLDLTGSAADLGLVVAARSIANVAVLLSAGSSPTASPAISCSSGRRSRPRSRRAVSPPSS